MQHQEQVFEEVLALARHAVKETHKVKLTSFVEAILPAIPDEFFEGMDPQAMLGFLMERLEFLEEDKDETVKLQVGHPSGKFAPLALATTVIETRLPDCSFIIATLRETLRRYNIKIQRMIHPIIGVIRQGDQVVGIDRRCQEGEPQSLIYMHISKIPEEEWGALEATLRERLEALLLVNDHHKPTIDRLNSIEQAYNALHLEEAERNSEMRESCELIEWLRDDNFVFLGYGHFRFSEPDVIQDALGLLELESQSALRDVIRSLARIRRERYEVYSFYRTDCMSIVKSDAQIRYVGFRDFGSQGEVLGEHCFIGLLSSHSVGEPNKRVPIISARMKRVLDAANLRPNSYSYKKMRSVLNSMPLEDLFYYTDEETAQLVRFIEVAESGDHTRIHVRRRPHARRISVICVLPRENYSVAVKDRVSRLLCEHLGVPHLRTYLRQSDAESPLRLHFNVSPERESVSDEALEDLKSRVAKTLKTWDEQLESLLFERYPPRSEPVSNTRYLALSGMTAPYLWHRYGNAFPASYKEGLPASVAVSDIVAAEKLFTDQNVQVAMARIEPNGSHTGHTELRILSLDNLLLNDVVPVLEYMQLRARARVAEVLHPRDAQPVYITSFQVRGSDDEESASLEDPDMLRRMSEIVEAVLTETMHRDRLLGLAYLAGLDLRQIELLITYRNYFLQLFQNYTYYSVSEAFIQHPLCAQLAVKYFQARFDPATGLSREERLAGPLLEIERRYLDHLETVDIIQEDIILRLFLVLLRNTLRTNFYKAGQQHLISIKMDSRSIDQMPRPRPHVEIYVHGPVMEGIHLRGGAVARGGIRHSDRPDDFRTEVLDLVKTQMVKNTVIVPVGSKGGFITRNLYKDRDRMELEVRTQYQNFISGLLDLTDNITDAGVVAPQGIRYDDDDPYLVVAADKGTAHLSDTANALSQRYHFWLDDAFASGGSDGYDHKGMGITARGGWVCVERHFRELGIDIRKTSIQVVGIGDMSGDVFGNAMLLNDKLRLLGAFNHKHIFIDPDPDPAASFAERKRLFDMPRSSWTDYNPELISEGGGIYERSAKVIELSPQARAILGLSEDVGPLNGPALIRAMLQAETDLLWLGGIGTYVKASSENHIEVGDRANDNVRVDANTLRCRVIGEGANLGFTQRARTEFVLAGGLCNTDAVDNSAGVDCSDHEVNLKILCSHLVGKGLLADRAARNVLLRECEDAVARDVLQNNYLQSALTSMESLRSQSSLEPFLELIHYLEEHAGLYRPGEDIPADDEIREWHSTGRPIPRNLLTVLIAFTKNHIYPRILETNLPDEPFFRPYLQEYFPELVVERYGDHLHEHRLSREIIATVITNKLINQAGSTFFIEFSKEYNTTLDELVLRYFVCDALLDGPRFRAAVHGLDGQVEASEQYRALMELEATLRALVRWWSWNEDTFQVSPDAQTRSGFDEAVAGLIAHLDVETRARLSAHKTALMGKGFKDDLAERIATLPLIQNTFLIIDAQRQTARSCDDVARIFHELGEGLFFRWVNRLLEEQPPRDIWETHFHRRLSREIFSLREVVIKHVFDTHGGSVPAFLEHHEEGVAHIADTIHMITNSPTTALIPIFVLLEDYRRLL